MTALLTFLFLQLSRKPTRRDLDFATVYRRDPALLERKHLSGSFVQEVTDTS